MQRKRGPGIAIHPSRVRKARADAGLTLEALAGHEVSRTFIHQVETGKARPSLEVLKLIARRTGKPISYFERPKTENSESVELAAAMASASKQLRRFIANVQLTDSELEAMRLIEAVLKRAAVLAMGIKS